MFAQLLCRRDLLNDTLTRRFRIALPWLVLSLILLLQAITPAVAISQAPPPPKPPGNIYYVATTGVDAPSTVGSSSNPFRTIRYTYDKNIGAGDMSTDAKKLGTLVLY